MSDFDAVFDRVPWLRGAGTPERLAGLTNLNYRIGDFVLRISGAGTSEYISRVDEEVAARSAAAAGVNAEVLFFDTNDGLMVTRFIDGGVTMTPERFRTDPGAIRRAGRAMRQLHTEATPFANEYRVFDMIDEYKALLLSKSAPMPDGFDEVQAEAEVGRAALLANAVPVVPCHCDPLCENFLDTGEATYLIDYEYAGNNDPMWDLGDFSVEAGFGSEHDAVLLEAYFEGPHPAADAARMVIHKANCDLVWSLWGIIQHVNENPVDDFWAYGVGRFERCKTLMESDEFTRAIAVLGG
ncbi:MAG TPA: choline kinase family protein [Ilumatobacteraceae bacterium]|nr:choline kinase family protein [Ilumatobacteraceae bacterium]